MNKLNDMISMYSAAKSQHKIVHDLPIPVKTTTADFVETWSAILDEINAGASVARELQLHGACAALDYCANPLAGASRTDIDHNAYAQIRKDALTQLAGIHN